MRLELYGAAKVIIRAMDDLQALHDRSVRSALHIGYRAIGFRLYDGIAFATESLELRPVKNRELSALVLVAHGRLRPLGDRCTCGLFQRQGPGSCSDDQHGER